MEPLDPVIRLNPRIVRILGQNPSKFTLQGTNTYLIGESAPYILVDTGEGKPNYVPLLERVLRYGADDRRARQHISDIILSHWHPDHVGGLFSVLILLKSLWDAQNTPLPFIPPRLHKFPHTTLIGDWFQRAIEPIKPGMYTPSPTGSLFHDLHNGQSFPIPLSDASFQVIHSPGHSEDSISLLFPSEHALYTADTILGQGTTVFENLATYMSTLNLLLSYVDETTILYPAHGPLVNNGKQAIETYIEHRMEREAQIVKLLEQGEIWSTWDIVSKLYAEHPREVWEAAAITVNQHLEKLLTEGKVEKLDGEGKDTKWRLHT